MKDEHQRVIDKVGEMVLNVLAGNEVRVRQGGFGFEKHGTGRQTYVGSNATRRKSVYKILKPFSCMRLLLLCEKIVEGIAGGFTHVKRALWYQLKHVFPSESCFDEALVNLCRVLWVPRWKLHVFSSPKGVFTGSFCLKCVRTGHDIQFVPPHVFSVPLKATMLQDYQLKFCTNDSNKPRCVLLVEKFSVFHLIQQSYLSIVRKQGFDFILVTGKGYPDLSTRAFLKQIRVHLKLPIFGICDYNPHGLRLLLQYIRTSEGGSTYPEAQEYLVEDMNFMGLSFADVFLYSRDMFHNIRQAQTHQDKVVLNMLILELSSSEDIPEKVRNRFTYELDVMQKQGFKLELESLNQVYSAHSNLAASKAGDSCAHLRDE
eukprot:maker-scaffold_14-snap-gene-6.50-mRNA-1 protein AED:0.92 eAED:0.92 QI:0/0/0/0.5/1/1/2/0/372